MRKAGALSLYAARLLTVYLEKGNAAPFIATQEFVEECCIKGIDNFYRARKELLDVGYLEKQGKFYVYIPLSTAKKQIPNTLINKSIRGNLNQDRLIDSLRDTEIDTTSLENESIYLSRGVARQPVEPFRDLEHMTETIPTDRKNEKLSPQTVKDVHTTISTDRKREKPISTDSFPIGPDSLTDDRTTISTDRSEETIPPDSFPIPPDSLLDRCEVVDAEPADGDKLVKTSNFQARRRKQVEIAKEAWKEYFPKENALQDSRARNWLALTSDSVTNLHATLEEISQKPLKSPLSYIDKVIRNRASEGKYKPFTSPAKEEDEYTHKDAIGPDELHKPTPEELEHIQKERERFARIFADKS